MTEYASIPNEAYVYFAIRSDTLTKADCTRWLGMEPVETAGKGPNNNWQISTPLTEDPFLHPMIRDIVAQLVPIKDRLIAFKQAHPDLQYWLEVVLYQGDSAPGLGFENDTLRFLGEIGATIDCDIYRKSTP